MTRERPVLFSAPMVRALLAGTKTMTRRVVKPQPVDPYTDRDLPPGARPDSLPRCPYGEPGDQLWVTMASAATRSVDLVSRLKERTIQTESGCWEWFGQVNKKKYGVIRLGTKTLSAHRVAFEANKGAIPPDMHVLHRCDLPWCVNPDHLFLGTNSENVADKVAKGRTARVWGERNGHSTLTAKDVRAIRQLAITRTPQQEIAVRFGITQPQVSRILSGKRWGEPPVAQGSESRGTRSLRITDVRVERLQDISEEDAKAEGVSGYEAPEEWHAVREAASGHLEAITFPKRPSKAVIKALKLRDVRRYPASTVLTAKEAFERLWESINGPEAWSANPWVWVVSFERVNT